LEIKNKMKDIQEKINDSIGGKNEFERCVCCHEFTDFEKSTHIDFRQYYIEGAGQLDKKCYLKFYKGNK